MPIPAPPRQRQQVIKNATPAITKPAIAIFLVTSSVVLAKTAEAKVKTIKRVRKLVLFAIIFFFIHRLVRNEL